MRRLTNNWLFGAVSPLLTGRLDSDIYGNSCAELLNMKVHRQGGISRRPPLKKKLETGAYKRMIPFIIDKTHVYAVLLGAGAINVYDYLNNTLVGDTLTLPTHSESVHSWANISANQCAEVKYAQYYNDLYLVHPMFPLMRIRYSSIFTVSTPQVFVNQDVKPHYIKLTITMNQTVSAENISFTFDGVNHSFSIQPTTSASAIITVLNSYDYPGWTVETESNTISFTPIGTMDKYIQYDFNDSDLFRFSDGSGNPPSSFTPVFSLEDLDEDELGVVYGSDDFNDCYLNRMNDLGVYEFASDIAIVAEKMFLTVNGNPCNIYASRPYGTSQIVYPKRSNDTILDFVQFELVMTENTTMKDEADLPVSIIKDTTGEVVYEGVSTDQKLWFTPSANQITDRKSLDEYRKGKYVNGDYVAYSANEFVVEYESGQPNIVKKLKRITTSATTEVDYIERVEVYYRTYDETVDTSKLTYDRTTHEYATDRYFLKLNSTDAETFISEHPDVQYEHTSYGYFFEVEITDDGYAGLQNRYEKTKDNYLNSRAAYYTRSGSGTSQEPYVYTYVTNAKLEDISTYYEKSVVFTESSDLPSSAEVCEYGYQYVYSGTYNQLRATYLDNGMIGSLTYNDVEVIKAIPYYQFDMSVESNIYETSVEVDKVATASTSMEFQLSSGRNDRIEWMRLGDYVMVGTESSEWRLDSDMNALSSTAKMYSSFGSDNGLSINLGTDVVFLQRGNGLRLFYKDYYGLQNVELTLTNPDIMKGSIKELAGMVTPEPAIYALKTNGDITALCVDRNNGVQAFSAWTFTSEKPVSICVLENDSTQILVALMSDGTHTYIAEFDSTEILHFADCGYQFRKTEDTTIVSQKTYYAKRGEVFEEALPVINPKTEGLYEFGLYDDVRNYVSRMTANPFDTVLQDGSVTIGIAKNVSKMIFRCLDTGHLITYFNPKDKTLTRSPICCDSTGTYERGLADHAVNVNGGTTRDLMISVESVGDEPMTLLAMAYELRMNRNG